MVEPNPTRNQTPCATRVPICMVNALVPRPRVAHPMRAISPSRYVLGRPIGLSSAGASLPICASEPRAPSLQRWYQATGTGRRRGSPRPTARRLRSRAGESPPTLDREGCRVRRQTAVSQRRSGLTAMSGSCSNTSMPAAASAPACERLYELASRRRPPACIQYDRAGRNFANSRSASRWCVSSAQRYVQRDTLSVSAQQLVEARPPDAVALAAFRPAPRGRARRARARTRAPLSDEPTDPAVADEPEGPDRSRASCRAPCSSAKPRAGDAVARSGAAARRRASARSCGRRRPPRRHEACRRPRRRARERRARRCCRSLRPCVRSPQSWKSRDQLRVDGPR